MHNFFVNKEQLSDNLEIIGSDVNHIKNVLRLKLEDEICIHIKETAEKYLCKIKEINTSKIICSIIEKMQEQKETDVYINIVQALPKSDKMELIIQKCTELGVKEFTPLQLNRCIVKINASEQEKKVTRWQNIAEVAAKQCDRDIIPNVNNIYNISTVKKLLVEYDLVLVAYENERESLLKNIISDAHRGIKKIAIIIGPEGGIEEKEIQEFKDYGYRVVSLGSRILRTETVGIALSSIIMYVLGDLGGI